MVDKEKLRAWLQDAAVDAARTTFQSGSLLLSDSYNEVGSIVAATAVADMVPVGDNLSITFFFPQAAKRKSIAMNMSPSFFIGNGFLLNPTSSPPCLPDGCLNFRKI